MANPINRTNNAYPTYAGVGFINVTSPNAMVRPTPITVTTYRNITIPEFNKKAANSLPSAVMVIRGLIRGNTS